MQWYNDPGASEEGNERVVTKFLLFPRTFEEEHRWLQKAAITERVIKQDIGGSDQWGYYKWVWAEVGFAND